MIRRPSTGPSEPEMASRIAFTAVSVRSIILCSLSARPVRRDPRASDMPRGKLRTFGRLVAIFARRFSDDCPVHDSAQPWAAGPERSGLRSAWPADAIHMSLGHLIESFHVHRYVASDLLCRSNN